MLNKKRLVFITSIAAPHQVKFCYSLQKYFYTEFWFYKCLNKERSSWWKINLGAKCKILDNVFFKKSGKYLSFSVLKKLKNFDPDIIMIGGFSIPANYLIYLWGKRNGKKVIVLTERSRDKNAKLRKWFPFWMIMRFLYRKIDIIITTADDIVPQFRDEFRFGDKVVAGRYAADIDSYFDHEIRNAKKAYTYLYPNRLTRIYNPILAIEVFNKVLKENPGSKLFMNAAGEMLNDCEEKIQLLGIGNSVSFLTNIKSWDDLHKVYEQSDIMILPAIFSNGNFTIIEAMASGMGIVISNKILGVGNYIVDGINGFNCEPTEEAFFNGINKYIKDPELFEKHTIINRLKARPLSTKGTAKFFYSLISNNLLK